MPRSQVHDLESVCFFAVRHDNKSIATPHFILGSVLGAVTWAAAALSENDVVAWSLASAAIVAPLLLWLELAADYRSVEHKNCCGQYPPAQGTRA